MSSAVVLIAVLTAVNVRADELAERIAALTKPFKGTVALYAMNLDNGRDFSLDADAKVRTASTIKLPILCALESAVASGRVRWDEPAVVRKAGQVSGPAYWPISATARRCRCATSPS